MFSLLSNSFTPLYRTLFTYFALFSMNSFHLMVFLVFCFHSPLFWVYFARCNGFVPIADHYKCNSTISRCYLLSHIHRWQSHIHKHQKVHQTNTYTHTNKPFGRREKISGRKKARSKMIIRRKCTMEHQRVFFLGSLYELYGRHARTHNESLFHFCCYCCCCWFHMNFGIPLRPLYTLWMQQYRSLYSLPFFSFY